MGRRSVEVEVTQKVEAYLAIAEGKLPEESPIHVLAVAEALNVSRNTLYKYGLKKVIEEAAERQRQQANLSTRAKEKKAYADRIKSLRVELEIAQQQMIVQAELINRMRCNAIQFNMDLKKLEQPLEKSDRSFSRAGITQRRGKKSAGFS
ncbi:hypothetical protein H6F67_12520 [Microcoleus sp. FACHB-1515]|uniref:hypothetical protein n=1 Tax=Cyanophyceae TaxID=3028117 RepID=UPI001686A63C|nr:hypothetical protein [Microcoleus sp. FACHB-1515]MBD2090678.1 hypothetical protein [Microcoleus sp. FACHB-1515]